ncbi:hypothetical protein AQJ84_04580 [Streptomyces resistomycificus]|nr:hypothetical protein AQJ84_04580 [Streptomyces resistomycificus]
MANRSIVSDQSRRTHFQDLFWKQLDGLHEAAGDPLDKDLIDAASKKGVSIADATLNDWFKHKSVPSDRSARQFTALVADLEQRARQRHGTRYAQHGVDFGQLRADAHKERLRKNQHGGQADETQFATSTDLGRPVQEITDPFALEVHRPISIPGSDDLDPLPSYVERGHDSVLGKMVQDAVNGQSSIAVLIGMSSSGKSRACWEAVQALPTGWRLWRPTTPSTAAAQLNQVGNRTVIWLDDTHDSFLYTPSPDEGENFARSLIELLHDSSRAPVLVLETIWPDTWKTLIIGHDGDRQRQRARQLLTGHGIEVPPSFTSMADLAKLAEKAADDPRLAQAQAEAEDGEITQYLAGVPVLMERYRTAPDGAKSLIWAAMDLRRLGHPRAIPLDLLKPVALGYLSSSQWHRLSREADWLHEVIQYVEADCLGARGPLTPIHPSPGIPPLGTPHYRLADPLEQHARSVRRTVVPPEAFWEAIARNVDNPELLFVFAEAAEKRWLLRHSAQLFLKSGDAGLGFILQAAGTTFESRSDG